jgi:hypothetical protein
MRCIWNVDELYTINTFLGRRFLRKPTQQQLADEKAQSTELFVLLLNSDLLVNTPHQNSLQILLPYRDVNVLLMEHQVIAWLKQHSNQIGEVLLSDADRNQLEGFLAEFDPFYDVIEQCKKECSGEAPR